MKRRKHQGKREEDLRDHPVEPIPHIRSEEKLTEIFGTKGWKQLPDEVYKRVKIVTAVYTVEEYYVAVYMGKDNQTIVKADRQIVLAIYGFTIQGSITKTHQLSCMITREPVMLQLWKHF